MFSRHFTGLLLTFQGCWRQPHFPSFLPLQVFIDQFHPFFFCYCVLVSVGVVDNLVYCASEAIEDYGNIGVGALCALVG